MSGCCVAVALLVTSAGAADEAGQYVVNALDLGGGNIELIRTDTASGECWRLVRDTWTSLAAPDLAGGESGDFDVALIRVSQEGFLIAVCRRSDGQTATWNNSAQRWQTVNEPGS